ncbi:MAG: hypothetical protein AAF297_00695 [Planctomycetota bacterium]
MKKKREITQRRLEFTSIFMFFYGLGMGYLFFGREDQEIKERAPFIQSVEPAVRHIESGAWEAGTTFDEITAALGPRPEVAVGIIRAWDPDDVEWKLLYCSDGGQSASVWFRNDVVFAADWPGADPSHPLFLDNEKREVIEDLEGLTTP